MALRPFRLLPERLRLPALLLAGVLSIAAGVWFASYAQGGAATRVADQARDVQLMLTSMLDQETGLRGFLLTRRHDFLEPYTAGRHDFDAALSEASIGAEGDPLLRDLIAQQETVVRRWQSLAEQELAAPHPRGNAPDLGAILLRKSRMDRFRAINASATRLIDGHRRAQLRDAGRVAVGVILVLGLAFGALGTLLIWRGRRTREREQEFAENLQVMRSEGEAHALLREYVERSVPGSSVVVLTRNNSADRLEPSTRLSDADPLHDPLEGAVPESCLAVRLARPHAHATGTQSLLQCAVCGKTPAASLCQPLLVGGEVLGSVLLRKGSKPTPSERERLAHTVSRAAPALANLRNLAIAEARAHTDPLTNLANKRGIQDTIRRLHAHAARTGSPLSVVLADLDHFKRINDTYGHERGDEALAAAAEALSGGVRRSDFVGRMGGEEFIVLLPDTAADAAQIVANNLRRAIGSMRLPGVHGGLTASFGVATFPDASLEIDALLRLADRALYLAKKLGRDRVESAAGAEQGDADPPAGLATSPG
jgi:diguanylate cyclase (GGDEF)-like protein